MPATDDQLQAEYDQAPEEQQLDDAEYERVRQLTTHQFADLPAATRTAFYATWKYYFGKRQQIESAEGIVVGDKSAADILAAKSPPE